MFDPIPVSDTMIILFFGTLVLTGAYLLEWLALKGKITTLYARKYLTIIAMGACAIVAALVENIYFLALLVAITEILILFLIYNGKYKTADGKKGWGFAYFPLAYFVLILLFPNDRLLIVAPMGLLALADGAASVFGEQFSKNFFNLTGDRKSLIGAIAFVVVSFMWFVVLGCFGYGHSQTWPEYLIMAFSLSILAAAAELLGSDGRDNLWIPLTTAFTLWAVYQSPASINVYSLAITVLVLIVGSFFVFKYGLLTDSGAVAAALIGIGIIEFGGFSLFPMLIFFLSSAALEKIPLKSPIDGDVRAPRTSRQVFSNGAMALFLADLNVIAPSATISTLYLVACAVAIADTWSSIIGVRFGGVPLDIGSFRKIKPGVSGGISLVGLLASCAGAGIIALFASSLKVGIVVFSLGLLGSIIDSILGSFLQIRYIDKNGYITDSPTEAKNSGIKWINNNTVNFLSIAITVLIAALIL